MLKMLLYAHYTRFPVTFPAYGEAANLFGLVSTRPTSPQQVVVMEFGKRHDTTDTTHFFPRQLVNGLLRTCRLCCGLVEDSLRGKWYNEWILAFIGVNEDNLK